MLDMLKNKYDLKKLEKEYRIVEESGKIDDMRDWFKVQRISEEMGLKLLLNTTFDRHEYKILQVIIIMKREGKLKKEWGIK